MDKILVDSRKELEQKLGIRPSVFDDLIERYSDSKRHYHNLDHVAECLRLFNKFKHLANGYHVIQAAIWFHDAIYDPKRHDNELRSAELAHEALLKDGMSKGFSKEVYDIIIGAVYNNISKERNIILMRDIDFSILGSSPVLYDGYAENIRKEYSHLDNTEFAKGRKDFLEKLIKQEIFIIPEFKELFADKAKQNILRETKRLGSSLRA